MIELIIGLFIGTPLGFILSALCTANSHNEDGDIYQ